MKKLILATFLLIALGVSLVAALTQEECILEDRATCDPQAPACPTGQVCNLDNYNYWNTVTSNCETKSNNYCMASPNEAVPELNTWGILALIAVVAVAGFFLLKKK